MKNYRKIYNPNYLYIITFIFPFVVYSLQWSTLYPPLSASLLMFYVGSFIVYLITGYLSNRIKPFYFSQIPKSSYNVLFVSVILGLYVTEILLFRKIPLLGMLRGDFTYGDDFGIPVIHTLLVSFNSFYCVYLFHQYISKKNKKLLLQFLLLLVPYIILVYRSNILGVFVSCFFIFLLNNKITYKIVLTSVVAVLLIFYGFGFLGNLRSGEGDSTYIARASGATDKFLDGFVPKEYYWTYLYVASPVANLQNNINLTKQNEGSWKVLVLNECFPDFMIKFLPFVHREEKSFYQINSFLNVGTIYVYSFSFLRWEGMLFMFFYFLIFINAYYWLLYRSSRFRIVGMALLFNLIIFANFHNTISYSASSLQLLYPVVFSFLQTKDRII
jgi:hypothetical protein